MDPMDHHGRARPDPTWTLTPGFPPVAAPPPASPPPPRESGGVDLRRYGAVLWRFRALTLGGLVLALALAAFAYVGLGGSNSYRSTSTVFVTQPGFPWGRAVQQFLPGNQRDGKPSVPVADPDHLANLTGLYAQLARSDQVRGLLTASDRQDGKVTVSAVPAPQYATPAILPLLRFSAVAPSGPRAEKLADAATAAFSGWLRGRQQANRIPIDQRIIAQTVNTATPATVASSRSKSVPIVIFLAVLSATVALAFALENIRPRRPSGGLPADPDLPPVPSYAPAANGDRTPVPERWVPAGSRD